MYWRKYTVNRSGLGAWSDPQLGKLFSEILPEKFQLAAKGKLSVQTVTQKLENISELWNLDVPDGKRLVIII